MFHRLHTDYAPPGATATPRKKVSDKSRLRRLGELLRGLTFGGIAFLLGSCSLLFGAAPLGIALLCASSSYTWYIGGGLLLSALLRPVTLSGWAWVGVYLLAVILRLVIRFFVDPPSLPDGRPCRGRTYLLLCWVSFKRNVGLIRNDPPGGDTETDYYPGEGAKDSSAEDKSPSARGNAPTVRLFAEHPFLRMLTAAVCGFGAGLSALLTGGVHVYDLWCLLCFLTVCPAATFLLVSCFGEAGLTLLFSDKPLRGGVPLRGSALSEQDGGALRVGHKFHALPLVSVCVLIATAVFAARSFSFTAGTEYLRLQTSTLLGLCITLSAASRLGVVPGVAVGVICGLAAEPRLAPVFILCAGTYSLLRYVSHRAGVLGGCAVGGGWCVLVEGITVLAVQLPAILLTAPVFFVAERIRSALPDSRPAHADRELEDFTAAVTASLTAESRAEAQRARMKALSEAFGSLSQRFYNLSSQLKRPRMLDLRRLCDESFGKKCARCRNRDVCWGAEYDRTLEIQTRLAAQLHTGSRASAESLPDSLQDFCPYIEDIVNDINGRCARMTENLLRSEKTEVFAADYAAIAALLEDVLEEDRVSAENFSCNREAADAIFDYLTAEGVTVQGVVVGGRKSSQRQRVIVRGIGFEAVADRLQEVRDRIGNICGTAMTAPVFDEGEDGGASAVMTLCSDAKLRVTYAGSTVPADLPAGSAFPEPLTDSTPDGVYSPPAVCGDHIAMFKTDDAYFYALISDGMGSGEDASVTSDVCAMFLEKMLSAGNRVEISLRMLDTYVRSKNTGTGDECSATVDLMELDLMDGRAVFAKNGAAPTYVVRDGTVYKLRKSTLPIGILKDTPPNLLRFRTHPGDVVVMVSDGVTLGNDECPWLIDLLSAPIPDSMDSLRRDIIKRALTAGSEDDLSAIAIRVEER